MDLTEWKRVTVNKSKEELDEMLHWCICNICVSTKTWYDNSTWEYYPKEDGSTFYFMDEDVYTEFVMKFC